MLGVLGALVLPELGLLAEPLFDGLLLDVLPELDGLLTLTEPELELEGLLELALPLDPEGLLDELPEAEVLLPEVFFAELFDVEAVLFEVLSDVF